jgi:beta-glucosidase-like glycosyl hydrolase
MSFFSLGSLGFAALLQAVALLMGPPAAPYEPTAVDRLSPREKAALVVVSGFPAPRGAAGVLVQTWSRGLRPPRAAVVFVDQEGGSASTFDSLPPGAPASSFTAQTDAFRAGRETARALRKAGVHVDLAPVLDAPGGPLGSRHFRSPALALAFARGLAAGGAGACPKHFPGLGTASVSTDEHPHVKARLRRAELRVFRRAIAAGVPCVMVGHAEYRELGPLRASFNRSAYGLLRRAGFEGVAITDSLSVFGSAWAVRAGRLAIRAGADLLLYTKGADARRVVRSLVPLARRGLLDERVDRVLRLLNSFNLPRH